MRGDVEIYFDATHGFLRIDQSLLVIRLIDGEFPEYDQVIPKENDKKLLMQKSEVSGCLRRVSIMASDRVEGVKLSLRDNALELSSYHQDFGDAMEEVSVVYQGSTLDVGFNARYLIDALNAIDTDEVTMELRDEGSPGILKPTRGGPLQDQICIIMPMRI